MRPRRDHVGHRDADPPLACSLLVDGLDAISWALLASAGVTRQACALLASLWTSEDGTTQWSG